MKVPAVTIDITNDGTAYVVTALPWPTIEATPHPFTARLVYSNGRYATKWTDKKVAEFVKKLMATYPKVAT